MIAKARISAVNNIQVQVYLAKGNMIWLPKTPEYEHLVVGQKVAFDTIRFKILTVSPLTAEEFAFTCDWSISGSVSWLEKQLNGFKFKGAGWYNEGSGQYMLILQIPEPITESLAPRDEPVYRAFVYGTDPRPTLTLALELPEYHDRDGSLEPGEGRTTDVS